ncbi:hypothetical protein [Pseudoxanthomonas mexicana]|uniref:hypothetical protein n=1 Tax=Pseudoxanthomonas mexicana TaxID=128785 RepID=UPI00398B4E40
MKGISVAGAALLLAGAVMNARAETVQGQLELAWGDPLPVPGAPRSAQLHATLLTDNGVRLSLDAAQAKAAAGDLYALSGRRVAVSFAGTQRTMSQQRPIQAIVATDRLWQAAPERDASGKVMAQAPVLGNTRWITLMCRFSDIATEQKDKAFFDSQYGNAVGQLGHYWAEVSYGKINLAGSLSYGWYALPQPRSFYVTKEGDKDKANLSQLFQDCIAAADPDVDFRGATGINMMFNGDLDGYAWGGGRTATLDGERKYWSTTWNPPWSFNNLAPLAHEMGHGYGLPHSDNSDGDSDTYDNPWDVMSDAWNNAVSDPTYGSRPKHVNILQRHRLNWVDSARQLVIPFANTTTRTVNLDFASLPGSTNVQMLVLSLSPQADPYATVVYTVEARRPEGAYEGRLAGTAVIIHKVEKYGTAYSIDADVPPANRSNNEGSMFKVGERWGTPDDSHWISVDAATATGFRLTVGPKPRVMSTPLPALRGNGAGVSAAGGVQRLPAEAAAPVERPDDCQPRRTHAQATVRCQVR